MNSFKTFYEQCNVCANQLKPGDHIENINPECDHYRSKGIVLKIKKIPQDEEKTIGNVIIYKVANNSDDFDPKDVNGIFRTGDKLAKTEIQLKRLNEDWKKFVPGFPSNYIPNVAKMQTKYLKGTADNWGSFGQGVSNMVNQAKYAAVKSAINAASPISKKAREAKKKIDTGEAALKYMNIKGKLTDIKPRDLLNPEVQKALPAKVAAETEKDTAAASAAATALKSLFRKK